MPTAPNYGLLGLAQGAGSLPMDIAEGQNSALALKLRGIQAQEAQRQLSQSQAEDVAGSMPIAPKMQTVPGTPSGPDATQQAATNQRNIQNQISQYGDEGQNAGPGAFTPQPQTPGTPETQKPYEFVTPYEQMAYETQQRADRLRSMGMGRSAMLHQKEAMEYGQMHYKTALSGIASSILSGNTERAKQFANSLGQNIQDIKQDPDDPDYYHVTTAGQDGKPVDMIVSKGDFLDATDPDKAITAYARLMSADKQAEARKAVQAMRSKTAEQIAQNKLDMQKQVFGTQKTPAKLIVWDAVENRIRHDHPGIGDLELHKLVSQDPLISAVGAGTERLDRNISMQMVKIIRQEEGGEPPKTSPVYSEYQNYKKMAMEGKPSPASATQPTQPPSGKVDVQSERAMAKEALDANPALADRIKSTFKTRTGQDY